MHRPKLNYFSPLPPLKSGISDYSEELLEELKKHFDITAFIDEGYEANPLKGIKIENHRKYNPKIPTIHNIGNSPLHIYSYQKLEKNPEIIIMHDLILQGLSFERIHKDWSRLRLLREVLINYGPSAMLDYIKFFSVKPYINKINTKDKKHSISNFHQVETENNKKFRWTNKKSSFSIKERNITEITLEIATDFPVKITINLNETKRKFKLKWNESKKIIIKVPKSKSLKASIVKSKPLGIISKMKDTHFRTMGIKVFKISYEKNRKEYEFPLFEENRIKNKKFLPIKEKIMYSYPLNRKIIKLSKAIITHSEHLKNIAKEINPKIPIKVIPEGSYLLSKNKSKKEIMEKLGLKNDKFIICSFGKIQRHKRLFQSLNAFKEFSKDNNSQYILIGESDESIDIYKMIKDLKIEDKVIITEYLPLKKVYEYIQASDVCINMRWPTTGATSGSLIRSLSLGTPCIISDLPENNEFPKSCVIKIKKDENEINNILDALNKLKNKKAQKEMSNNAINHIKKHHLWEDKTKELRDFILKVYNENSNNKSIR